MDSVLIVYSLYKDDAFKNCSVHHFYRLSNNKYQFDNTNANNRRKWCSDVIFLLPCKNLIWYTRWHVRERRLQIKCVQLPNPNSVFITIHTAHNGNVNLMLHNTKKLNNIAVLRGNVRKRKENSVRSFSKENRKIKQKSTFCRFCGLTP